MKKIIFSFLALILICGSVLLVGCNGEDKFWQSTNTLVNNFVNKTEYDFLTDEDVSLTYEGSVEFLTNHDDDYSQLKTYYSIAKSFMAMFNKQYVNLNIKPTVNKQTKGHYKTFENKLNDLQKAIDSFLTSKATFEQNLSVLGGNYFSDAAKNELRQFRRDYKKLLDSVALFSESFDNLYQNAYLGVPTQKITLHQMGYENLILSVSVNKILNAYVEYLFDDGDGLIPMNANHTALTKVNLIRQNLKNANYKENTLEIINQITVFTQMFDNEQANFYTALKVVNMTQLREDGKTEYLANHPEQIAFVNQIDRYNETVLTTYTNQILNLCAAEE